MPPFLLARVAEDKEAMFDKIAVRQFWARGEAERSERSEDEEHARACSEQSHPGHHSLC